MLSVTENPPNNQSFECLPHSVCTFLFIGRSLLLLRRAVFLDPVEVVGEGVFDCDEGGDLPLKEDEDDINWLAVSRNEVLLFRS